jgi:predicted DNA-binding antitoxin AbrB/MazE fold protein
MSQILEATFDGAVFLPTETVELQPSTRVELIVTVKDTPEESRSRFFARLAL